jgi:hypothetical protein
MSSIDNMHDAWYHIPMKLIETLKNIILTHSEPRYRDRRSFYASELTKDARDLFWRLTGVPETNPSDLVSKIRMGLGSAIEGYIVQQLKAGSLYGLKFLGTQIPIGGSEPVKVDGYLDGLVEDEQGNKYVIEVKSKWGWGASFFMRDLDPGESYMAQMGYYLRDLSAKGVTNKGIFIFVPIGDDTFGDLVAIYCEYDSTTDTVRAYSSENTQGETRPLNISLQLGPVLQKLKDTEGYVQRNELPPVDKQYKYPLTPDVLAAASDAAIKKAAANEKVLGDWEISYSSFKAMHMQLQGTAGGYSEDELALLNEELGKREAAKRAASNAKRAATIAAKKRSA